MPRIGICAINYPHHIRRRGSNREPILGRSEPSIRKAISTGRPRVVERFIKRLEKIIERDILPKKAGELQKESKKIREVFLL